MTESAGTNRRDGFTAAHACQRCGSDEWEYVDYGGCSKCRPHEERDAEDGDALDEAIYQQTGRHPADG